MGNGKKRKRSDKFEVVPAGFSGRGKGSSGGGGSGGGKHNTLRRAFGGAMSKADEIWFRKCGHGERLFTSYYRGQRNVVPLEEWDAFQATIGTPLPVTFRMRAGGGDARSELEEQVRSVGCARPPAWASAEMGIWQASKLDKRALSKSEAGSQEAALAAVLAAGVSHGLLNRQEAVSMLPVLALRVPAGACVLDMCASPGSKTMQLMEAVAADDDRLSRGMVVANDAHPKRIQALLGSLERHARPAHERAKLVVTCHRGEAFPAPQRPFRKPSSGAAPAAVEDSLGFDRVLADVPCSGDGTIRKDPTVLPRWTPAVGTQLHAAQLEIAWRGLQLLKVGGTMVYSTCSLNPIEDEAVVAALLARSEAAAPGAVQLAKWPKDVLPQLKRRSGLSSWRVADHVDWRAGAVVDGDGGGSGSGSDLEGEDDEVRLRWHENFDAAQAAGMPHATPTLWPPSPDVAASMHLERCSRLLPHDQDTGGFFVTLLRKRAPLCHMDESAADAASGASLPSNGPASCRELPPLPEEDGCVLLSPAEAERLGASGEIRGARTRLYRRRGDAAGDERLVQVAPTALAAFAPGAVCVARAGLPLATHTAGV